MWIFNFRIIITEQQISTSGNFQTALAQFLEGIGTIQRYHEDRADVLVLSAKSGRNLRFQCKPFHIAKICWWNSYVLRVLPMKITWKRSETITLNVFSNVRHEINQFWLPKRLYQAKTIDLTLFWLIANESQSLVYALLPIAKSTKTDFSEKRWVAARDLIYSYSVMQKRNSIRFSRWRSTWQGVSEFRGQNRRCWEIAIITWLQKDQNWFWGQTIFSGKRFDRVWLQNI